MQQLALPVRGSSKVAQLCILYSDAPELSQYYSAVSDVVS
jgi:hypothetical protein